MSKLFDRNGGVLFVNGLNVAIYIDYENLFKRLKRYNVHPIRDIDFFNFIASEFRRSNCNILKFVVFANFEDSDFSIKDQTLIHNFGVEVKHSSIDGKSSSDKELLVEAMKDLYKKPLIDVFVIVSNDRDYIPLYQAIKLESKKTYVLSTKNGINDVVGVFADYHQYIEELFDFGARGLAVTESENKIGVEKQISEEMDKKARDVASFFYQSDFWNNYKNHSKYVGLNGYAQQLVRIMTHESRNDIIYYFNIAHTQEYITIYEGENKVLCLKDGNKMQEFFATKQLQNVEPNDTILAEN